MATNCLIGVTHGDTIKVIYCHFDGYLRGVGSTLLKHYDSVKANQLIALGNISYLEENIEVPSTSLEEHSFEKPVPGVTVFYGRDRGEKNQNFKTLICESAFNSHHGNFDYSYIMHEGDWYYIPGDKKFSDKKLLKDCI